MADQALGGYDPYAGLSAHDAERPQLIPVPSLLRALLSEHLDPGYAAAAAKRDGTGEPPTGRARVHGLGLASAGRVAGGHGVRRGRRSGPAGRTGGQCGPTGAGGRRAFGGGGDGRADRTPQRAYGATR